MNVHIKIGDYGWIIERLAKQLSDKLDYVSYDDRENPYADLTYYMTYATYVNRISPVQLGFFTHIEQGQEHRDRFLGIGKQMDRCVSMSDFYTKELVEAGIPSEKVVSITPGVDLDRFSPKVKIGIVGRTYHTGRKGEHLIEEVMDISQIEWHFTGTGWPGSSRFIPDSELPDFYRSMDYILVSSLYEAGPMCVKEALACGTPVISPPVGFVPQFPHYEFKTGDKDDLRRVLLEAVDRKMQLRRSVEAESWDNWVNQHDLLFKDLLGGPDFESGEKEPKAPLPSVNLYLHGSERTTLGGPSTRVPRLANQLIGAGYNASFNHFSANTFSPSDLVHGFNVWQPQHALRFAQKIKEAGIPLVFSPIFLDLSERELYQNDVPQAFADGLETDSLDEKLREIKDRAAEWTEDRAPKEIHPGYFAQVRKILEFADGLIFLSEKEKSDLETIGFKAKRWKVVQNPIDTIPFRDGNPELFKEEYGVEDYLLCVGRIEPRKNQLMLAYAVKEMNIPLVLIGGVGDPGYLELIHRVGGENLLHVERLSPGGPMLASAYAGAKVFCLPSWSEGAPLCALEAAASGVPIVLSNRSSESEMFGDLASYCDPADPDSIKSSIQNEWKRTDNASGEALRKHVEARFSWDRHVHETATFYREVLKDAPKTTVDWEKLNWRAVKESSNVVMDVTTTAHHKGRVTGIARTEATLAQELKKILGPRLSFSVWNTALRMLIPFEEIPDDLSLLKHHAESQSIARARGIGVEPPASLIDPPEGSVYILGGSSWMQNPRNTEDIILTVQSRNLRLVLIVYDLIPIVNPSWHPPGYTQTFEHNFYRLLKLASGILCISEHTKKDLEKISAKQGISLPQTEVFRLGDRISPLQISGGDEEEVVPPEIRFQSILEHPFVLNVGSLHYRKNQEFLYRIWKRLIPQLRGKTPRLVIVGGVGWNAEQWHQLISGDPEVKPFIHLLKNISDEELSWLYEKSYFTVYPSLYEGWGLPIAESLSHGKICLTSNNTSVPEVAEEFTPMLDPYDFNSWLNRILYFSNHPEHIEKLEDALRANYQVREWDHTANQVQQFLDRLENRKPADEYLDFGKPLDLRNGLQSSPHKCWRWYSAHGGGSWLGGRRGVIKIPCPPSNAQSLVVHLWAASDGSMKGLPLKVRIGLNGAHLTTLIVLSSQPKRFSFTAPALFQKHKGGIMEFEFDVSSDVRITPLQRIPMPSVRSIIVSEIRVFEEDEEDTAYAEFLSQVEQENEIPPYTNFCDLEALPTYLDYLSLSPNWGLVSPLGIQSFKIPSDYIHKDRLSISGTLRAVAAHNKVQSILFLIDGEIVHIIDVASSEDTEFDLKLDLPGNSKSEALLQVAAQSLLSPKQLGLDSTAEQIGFGLKELRFDSAFLSRDDPSISLERELYFAEADSPSLLQLKGCYSPTVNGRWSKGDETVMRFWIGEEQSLPRMLYIRFEPIPFNDSAPFCLELYWDGNLLKTVKIQKSGIYNLSLMLPAVAEGGRFVPLSWKYSRKGNVANRIPPDFRKDASVYFYFLRVQKFLPIVLNQPALASEPVYLHQSGLGWHAAGVGEDAVPTRPDSLEFCIHNDTISQGDSLILQTEWESGEIGSDLVTTQVQPGQTESLSDSLLRVRDGNFIHQTCLTVPRDGEMASSISVQLSAIMNAIAEEFPERPGINGLTLKAFSLGPKTMETDFLLGYALPVNGFEPYALGTTLDLSDREIVQKYGIKGWHQPEADGIWSHGGSASLGIKMNFDSHRPLEIQLMGSLIQSKRNGANELEISLNGSGPLKANFKKKKATVLVPSELLLQEKYDQNILIDFRARYSVTPQREGLSNDSRDIGFRLSSFSITEKI